MANSQRFKNRIQAGKLLARALAAYTGHSDAIVLALPRGGVPVGFVVAKELGLELDILLVRKLGLPGHEEFAMGAIAPGGVRVLHPDVERLHRIPLHVIEEVSRRELAEIERRERQYRAGRPPLQLHDRTAILVDDGLATGSTMRAAVRIARKLGAKRVVAAVPVGAPETCAMLAAEVDEMVCLSKPMMFRAVSQWYREFDQTSDEEVQDLLALAWHEQAGAASAGAHG